MILAVLIGIAAVVVICSPFFFGAGGSLLAGTSAANADRLNAVKAAVIKRYLKDEASYEAKDISKRAWQTRQRFLMNRYIDAARRLDYLDKAETEASS